MLRARDHSARRPTTAERVPIRRYDPYAIVLDTDRELGREVHDLAGHGFEVELLHEIDVAAKWLAVQGDRPGVLILSAGLDAAMADQVNATLGCHLPGGSAAIVLVGEVPGRAEARHLADLGFRWLVRRPFTHEELHLGASAALGAGTWSDGRKCPRVPVDMRVDVACPGSIDTALVCDLSAGGMFLAMANPPETGDSLIIEMELGARTMLLRGVAAHRSHRASPDRSHGVGVRFEDLEPCDGRTIADYVEARLGSVRL